MKLFQILSYSSIICIERRRQFLPDSGRIDTAIWMHYLDAN